jgi:hypothetical protein
MIKILTNNHKFLDFINIKNTEIRISILVTVITWYIFASINFHDLYFSDQSVIIDIMSVLIASFISLIGLVLTGMAIFINLFSNKVAHRINESDDAFIEKILSSYILLAFSLGIFSAILLILKILIAYNFLPYNNYVLYALSLFVVYFTCFNIFYTIALVNNFIIIHKIYLTFSKVVQYEDIINERIISFWIAYTKDSNNGLRSSFEEYIAECNPKDKEALLTFLKKQY